MHNNHSPVRWRFDPEHIRYDSIAVMQAAKNGVDKIIQTLPLIYVASSGTALALELEDSLCSVLYGPSWARPLEIVELNDQFIINWSNVYMIHDAVIDILETMSGTLLLTIPVDHVIADEITGAGQSGNSGGGQRRP